MKKLLLAIVMTVSAGAAEVDRVAPHVFHSSFWISLHERLRHEVRTAETHALTNDEAWKEALAVYRKEIGTRSAVFDMDLIGLTHKIAKTADDATPKEIPEAVAAALVRAAPAYRAKLWPDDDRANRFWIAVAAAQLRDAGEEIMTGVARVYGTNWPKELHVDVVPYAEENGANTTNDWPFAHTAINSRSAGYQGFAALEMLVHEPMHHIDFPLQKRINELAKELGVSQPRGLSHVILFFTAGELTKRALIRRGVTDYKPAGYAFDVYARAWPKFIGPVEAHWMAVLDGKATRDEALRKILAALK